jgi:predicted alpha/beta-hydrolase family hydrolase
MSAAAYDPDKVFDPKTPEKSRTLHLHDLKSPMRTLTVDVTPDRLSQVRIQLIFLHL